MFHELVIGEFTINTFHNVNRFQKEWDNFIVVCRLMGYDVIIRDIRTAISVVVTNNNSEYDYLAQFEFNKFRSDHKALRDVFLETKFDKPAIYFDFLALTHKMNRVIENI